MTCLDETPQSADIVDASEPPANLPEVGQRAMVAARLANMKEGRPKETAQTCAVSQPEAAEMLNVSERGLRFADDECIPPLSTPAHLMRMAHDPEAMLSTHDAADLLGVAPKTLENWRNRRQGPTFYRAGRKVVYRAAELQLWLTNRRCAAMEA